MNWPTEAPADITQWVTNACGVMTDVAAAGQRWPVSLGACDRATSPTWLTSLVSALIGTPREEIENSDRRTLAARLAVAGLSVAERAALALGMDRAVIVNNTLLSVSPIGSARLVQLGAAVAAAARTWPERIVAARGIVADGAEVRRIARQVGGVAVPNRVSYVFDLRHGAPPDKINAVRDLALLRKANLEVVDHDGFSAADLSAAHAQYTAVYVDRHDGRNPRLTLAFFEALHRARAATFWGLRRAGDLLAFNALCDQGEFLSVPLIGYATAADKKAGLYRQIFALALQTAAARRAVINFGAGAGHYKKLRGGTPVVEYIVIVPPRDTWPGRLLSLALNASAGMLDRTVPRAITAYGG